MGPSLSKAIVSIAPIVPPLLAPVPRIIPLAVFAAGKERFEYLVRGYAGNREAKILAFRHLPLEENGWDRETARCRHIRTEPQGCVFLIERG